MVVNFLQIVKNYSFLLNLIKLPLALACLGILIHDETNLIPRWLWLIYCTNSLTYIVIIIAITGSYVFEENIEYLDIVFSVIGVPLYIVAGLSGIIRSRIYVPEDAKNESSEIILGILFIVNACLLIGHIIWSTYSQNRRITE